jgi:DnaJ-class molecular chaperone
MDIKHALEVLKLKSNYTMDELKKSYRIHAMKHHPDKNNNSEESCEKFKEINNAYLYLYDLSVSLGSHPSHMDSTDDSEAEASSDAGAESYMSIFRIFTQSLLQKMYTNISQENAKVTMDMIIKIIVEDCHELSLKMFEDMDKETAFTIYEIINKYHAVFHINSEKLILFERIIRKKMELDNLVIISVSLDDLFGENNIYILEHDEKKYYIPLWHTELYYKIGQKDNTPIDLIVRCMPSTPSHIYIDTNNDIYIDLRMKIIELLEKKQVLFHIGSKQFSIPASVLYIKDNQTHVLKGQGIPVINSKNMYDTSEKSSIFVNIELL